MTQVDILRDLAGRRGPTAGITSVCSAHPLVIEAALLQARDDGTPALIEATCNQVNQEGGYTGMQPAYFRDFVWSLADEVGLARSRVILGGDHLGPNPWRHLPAEVAMDKAQAMIAAYAAAGFSKLHLDASMGAAGEPDALDDARAASRAAALAACAEASAATPPVYVIGTEVPTPGGATHALDQLRPTAPDAVRATFGVHARAFADLGDAWARVIAIVVQPGVEFGHDSVAIYQPERAAGLSAALPDMPGLVFEAHSTDYQPEASLRRLVQDGFAILKVGPALTFALREALYALDHIAAVLRPEPGSLAETMERLMREQPGHWRTHYPGNPAAQHVLRHYSYSDRIRYYWPMPAAQAACAHLLDRLGAVEIPPTLVSQYLPRLYERVITGRLATDARRLLIESIRDVLRAYARACS
ncbi:D-tagatose-bisphosphate aldolase, class II, non-catalytic subunit [Lichenicoccus sp.]|uniref:D-tagatose-bisphosphate aldolase, class II, non-catalytic subunit n=1 Tax=Lichenicoccus sp. TaxID=2781899 RepID=UPI003D12D2E8